MKDMILKECRKNIRKFKIMNDMEIYEWICNNFYITDYEEARECSFIIYRESR